MSAQRFPFSGAAGQQCTAWLELPIDGQPSAYALFAHCFTCSGATTAAVNLSRALCRQGIAVLRFDFSGLAESESNGGKPSSSVADLVAAAAFMEERLAAPKILIGHSLGGAAVLRAAAQVPSAVAVATLGAPANSGGIVHLQQDDPQQAAASEQADAAAGQRFRISRQFLDDLEPREMAASIRALRRPLLILHAPLDEMVAVANAAEIFQAALHPKSYVSLDRADHLLSDERDSRYAGEVIAAWAARYIETPVAATVEELLAERGVAARTGAEGYRTEISARQHAWMADEPTAVGGADTGPTPYELLLAALGACTSMTLRMYADRKGWPLEEVTVRMHHSRVHALDEEQCEHRSPRVDRVARTVDVRGDLSTEQRARLLEIADRCPVHRTLEAGMRIDTLAVETPAQTTPEPGDHLHPAEPPA